MLTLRERRATLEALAQLLLQHEVVGRDHLDVLLTASGQKRYGSGAGLRSVNPEAQTASQAAATL